VNKPIWTATDGNGIHLLIYQDAYPPSPREWDNLGTIVCWHRRYTLGNPHEFPAPYDFTRAMKGIPMICYDIHIYDHSGIVLGLDGDQYPFNDRWDAGWVCYMYATYERIREDQGCKYVTRRVRDKVDGIFRAELEEYNKYLSGDVYGYRLVKSYSCPTCGQEVEEEVDSCWGFSGTEWKENGLVDQLASEYRDLAGKLEDVR